MHVTLIQRQPLLVCTLANLSKIQNEDDWWLISFSIRNDVHSNVSSFSFVNSFLCSKTYQAYSPSHRITWTISTLKFMPFK